MVVAILAVLGGVAAVALAIQSQRMRPVTTASERRIVELDPRPAAPPRGSTEAIELSAARARADSSLFDRERLMLERAGAPFSLAGYAVLHIVFALLGFALTFAIAGGGDGGLVLALVVGGVAFFVPRVYVMWRMRVRADQLEKQLIEMLSMVATSVRAGFSLMQSLESVSQRLGAPISEGVDRMIADVQLGRDQDDAMRDWVEYTGSRDVAIVVTAMLVQRSSGGNLAEVLENLAGTMRDRVELRAQLKSITAYPRMTARIVAVYPFVIALMLTAMRPDTWGMLWTTTTGNILLAIAIGLDVIAFIALRRIARLDF